jgi:apolipoprotein N-acyltransferase
MNSFPLRRGVRDFLTGLAATALSSLLFAASHPNPLVPGGLPFLAWIAYGPVFWLLYRVSLGASAFWGALYGYSASALFNYWLGDFHPLAGLIVNTLSLGYFLLLFPLLKTAILLFPRRAYILQWCLWMGFEYLKTVGFLGYPYGITGYTQWSLVPLIGIAAVVGVWGVSALVVFPSAFLAALFRELPGGRTAPRLRAVLRREAVPAALWLAALGGALVYGALVPAEYPDRPSVRVALIQHNTDPWKPSKAPTFKQVMEEYQNDFRILCRLSGEALSQGGGSSIWWSGPKPPLFPGSIGTVP